MVIKLKDTETGGNQYVVKIELYDAAKRKKISSEDDNFVDFPSVMNEPSSFVDGAVLDPLPALIKFI